MNNPKIKESLAWNRLGDKVVILTLKGEKFVHEINSVGGSIWTKCDGTLSAEQIADELAIEFDAPADEILSDTTAFLGQLKQNDLIDWGG